ncbi:fumarylacetoacetate hydrolase family protein [Ideonella livida]|uniref:Fumarylacetoacetate hydrolase family protein n=1 Tax=Ideonella livida TaxID=2707176 RepID=A0A7C9TNS5_9BURK|nr:fumarylacetoacetate hydrolase family protein [Ideonella livida]NDY93865.1 fumarylacetoacetate hydrolase family protein [Ideonella livida]
MKLATYQDGSRDGHLVVVSRDLSTAHFVSGIASRMSQLLDDWSFLSPALEDLYVTLNQGKARHAFPFEPAQCMAPLPRASRVAWASPWRHHHQLLAESEGRVLEDGALAQPWIGSLPADLLTGPRADLQVSAPALQAGELDAEAQLAVVGAELPLGAPPAAALERVRLFGLALGWTSRALARAERAAGQPPLGSRLGVGMAPVLVTPDELGEAWRGGRLSLPLSLHVNGRRLGQCDSGKDLGWTLGQLLAWQARTQRLGGGHLLLAGPVSPAEPGKGAGCVADARAWAARAGRDPDTHPWLEPGDEVLLEALGADGQSVFGALRQTLTGWDE